MPRIPARIKALQKCTYIKSWNIMELFTNSPRCALLVVFLLFVTTFSKVYAQEEDCEQLQCVNGGICMIRPNDGEERCVCPPGFEGVECEVTVDLCPNSPFRCFNGGTCIQTPSGQACDCSTASGLVAGVQCQQEATAVCTTAPEVESSTQSFCTNDGACNAFVQEGEEHMGCSCPDGFEGDKCQFITGECLLECFNGGVCNTGSANENRIFFCTCPAGFVGVQCETETCMDGRRCFNGASCIDTENGSFCDCTEANGLFAGLFCEHEATAVCLAGGNVENTQSFCTNGGVCNALVAEGEEHIGCSCLEGYEGDKCEIVSGSSVESCPKDCLNGAVCSRTPSGPACDCSTASGMFAGVQCEHEATAICAVMGSDVEAQFCTNGGVCNELVEEGDDHPGCSCPDGFEGDRCEFVTGSSMTPAPSMKFTSPSVPPTEEPSVSVAPSVSPTVSMVPSTSFSPTEECLLECFNDGVCSFDDSIDGNRTFICRCQDGFVGTQCETEAERFCLDGRICLNGAACVETESGSSCNCTAASGLFAGVACEHAATSICLASRRDTDTRSFCTNGGVCVEIVEDGDEHVGCTCPFEFVGDKCQFVRGSVTSPSPTASNGTPSPRPLMLGFASCLMFLLTTLVLG